MREEEPQDEMASRLPDKTQEEWHAIIKDWSEDVLMRNLPGAQRKESEGRGDNWSAAVVQVAKERGYI